MNKFDKYFFSKYVTDGAEVVDIAHKHILLILNTIILNYFFGVILPTFLYYNSNLFKSYMPFFVLEIFIISIFVKNIYNILDWYNDVWIITKEGVTELDWKLFSSNSVSVKYSSIEGLELIQTGFIDTILGKGDIIINKVGGENKFVLSSASKSFKILEKIDKIQKEHKAKMKKAAEPPPPKKEEKIGTFEDVMNTLSGVFEDYLSKNGYKKDDSEETKELIEKIKKIEGTIDLSK